MRKVRYSKLGESYYGSLRAGEIYDVIRCLPAVNGYDNSRIEISIDGYQSLFFACFFEDVTHKYRDNVIDEILN